VLALVFLIATIAPAAHRHAEAWAPLHHHALSECVHPPPAPLHAPADRSAPHDEDDCAICALGTIAKATVPPPVACLSVEPARTIAAVQPQQVPRAARLPAEPTRGPPIISIA
jgi:hypothetical protein